MAKRKRLSPTAAPQTPATPPQSPAGSGLETKGYTNGWEGMPPVRQAPIADVAGSAATAAALEEVSEELRSARANGRMVLMLDLTQIDESYMVRDRIEIDATDMQALMDSLAARGQQAPIEVIDLKGGTYGLISGWRRLLALRRLYESTKDPRFAKVQALVRTPDGTPEIYLAMVEENEIRSGISFYERARIAVRVAEQGAFATPKLAVRSLFAAAPRAKRSKINSFVALYEALGDALRFPSALSEKQGLALAKAVQDDADMGGLLKKALTAHPHDTPEAELAALQKALLRSKSESNKANSGVLAGLEPAGHSGGQPVYLRLSKGKLVLDGDGVTPALEADLRSWLARRS